MSYGPQINSVTWTVESDDGAAASDMKTGAINAYDLSFSATVFGTIIQTTCTQTQTYCTGATPGFSYDGIYFNQLRPIVNDTHFHRAIAYLMNLTYFLDTYLSGVAGIATNAVLPCQVFAGACDNSKTAPLYPSSTTAAEVHAVQQLEKIKVCTGPFDNKTGACHSYGGYWLTAKTSVTGSTNSTACDVLPYHSDCAGLKWQIAQTTQGLTADTAFVPTWVWRNSLGRVYMSNDIALITGPMIGLSFNLVGDGTLANAGKPLAINPAAAAVIHDGSMITSGSDKYYNTAPVYDYSQTLNGQPDSWDMYSYGWSASVNFVGTAMQLDDAYQVAKTDSTDYHNASANYAANQIIFALTAGQAATNGRALAHNQLVNLPEINVYFENTLFAVYANGWAGYANIPTYGPSTSTALGYTLLNVHNNCFQVGSPATCPNGGTYMLGLGDRPDPTGMNPYFSGTTVYDDDIWLNIYDSALNTPAGGFQKPAQFMNWMTSKYSSTICKTTDTASCLAKITKNSKLTATSPGLFNFQTGQGVTQHLGPAQVFTFTFQPNVYFNDHVQMNAYDYNFSLWAAGVTSPSSLPFLSTPWYGIAAGQLGLITTYINPAKPLTMYAVVNSSTAWNLLNLQVPILAMHVFKPYFSLDAIFSAVLAIDTSVPYTLANAYSNFTTGKLPASEWLLNLPNLEQGTGGFILRTFDPVTAAGELLRNPNYYRTYWQTYTINASQQVTKGTSYHLDLPVYEWSYNATICTVGDHVCEVPMSSAYLIGGMTGMTITGVPKAAVNGGAGLHYTAATGHIDATIDTTKLSAGMHKIVITTHYTYLGLARTWYQIYGFTVLKP